MPKLKPEPKQRRAPATLAAIVLAGIAACAGCQSSTSSTPNTLGAASPSSVDSASINGSASSTDGASSSPSASLSPSPAKSSASASAANALAGKVLVLDPGHDGGNETHAAEIATLVPQGFGAEKACDTTGTVGGDGYAEHQL